MHLRSSETKRLSIHTDSRFSTRAFCSETAQICLNLSTRQATHVEKKQTQGQSSTSTSNETYLDILTQWNSDAFCNTLLFLFLLFFISYSILVCSFVHFMHLSICLPLFIFCAGHLWHRSVHLSTSRSSTEQEMSGIPWTLATLVTQKNKRMRLVES